MPHKIIKNRAIVEDTFTHINEAGDLPAEGNVIIPQSLWPELESKLKDHNGKVGIKVSGDIEPEEIAGYLDSVDLIAIEFPVFRDGRGYSLARILRDRMGYEGELRACGDVLRDQMFYMQRCGFNSFEPIADRCIEEALTGLNDFSVTYQADANEKKPIYQRRS